MKLCTKCGEFKLPTSFYKVKADSLKLRARCIPCTNSDNELAYLKSKPAHNQRSKVNRLKQYGLSEEAYNEHLEKQGGGCAICSRTPEQNGKLLAVDHDHSCCPERCRSCGKCIRGLLCHRCNRTIGQLEEDCSLIIAALAYLGCTLD